MTAVELGMRLRARGVDSRLYSLDGTSPLLEGFVLDNNGDSWSVNFFERGETHQLAAFNSEDSACEFFYTRILRDLKIKD